MKTVELKFTRIGNSKGIRLPVELIQRYGFSESLAAAIREEGLLLKPKKIPSSPGRKPPARWRRATKIGPNGMPPSAMDWRAVLLPLNCTLGGALDLGFDAPVSRPQLLWTKFET